MRLVMGVDGGGSKTSALLADETGRVLGRGHSGASNYHSEGVAPAKKALLQAVQAAFLDAGLESRRLDAICLGMAGVDSPADIEWARGWVEHEGLAERVAVHNDGYLLLWAGTPRGWGVGLIAGTGSVTFGRSPDGRETRAGGWGWLHGDEGSAYDLGLSALRAVAQAADGRAAPTLLTGLVLETIGAAEAWGINDYVYQHANQRQRVAALAPLVQRAAQAGDAVAAAIERRAGENLADSALAVVRRLGLASPVPCALGGGALVHDDLLAQELIRAAGNLGLILEPVERVSEPVTGAVRLALMMVDS